MVGRESRGKGRNGKETGKERKNAAY